MKNKIKLFVFITTLLSLLSVTVTLAERLEQAASSCSLTTLDGKPAHDLQELKGRVVYIDFWAS